MIRRTGLLAAAAFVVLALVGSAQGAIGDCELQPDSKCFGVESLAASLSTDQAGDHPDLDFSFTINQDPNTPVGPLGLHDSYGPTRYVRIELPPGLIGNPNVLGTPQQCTVAQLAKGLEADCPNGSQVGVTRIYTAIPHVFTEPIYMMVPPGGDVVARLGFIAGSLPAFVDVRVRSESDYGLISEIVDSPAAARLLRAETTLWGVPADPSHDNERCTTVEAFDGCVASASRPPGSQPLPFLTNPTRCGVPLELRVAAASWAEPARFDTKPAPFPQISGCDKLPFGPALDVEPTTRHTSAPTGLDLTIRLPASDGVNVLEPAQTRDIRINFPRGLSINPGAADGLAVCSAEQVGFGTRETSHCPDAAKMATTEFDIAALPRRMKGAIYLREPEPGNPFRVWVVADDLGAHVKLSGQLHVDLASGQIESIVLDAPQAPLREVKLEFKSGFRAPLVTPSQCGALSTHYEFTSWAGGPSVVGDTQMEFDEGCGPQGFDPRLSAGSQDAGAGRHSPFLFTITREDGEQNPASFDLSLPRGLAATFAGIPACTGLSAQTGTCLPASRIGRVTAAVGTGSAPLWVPQPGKRPTAVYLSGPYEGAPLSIVAVVPREAGPFDFGDEVVRSAIFVDPVTARATAKTDPLPQFIEGIPINYRAIHVELDRPGFALNPTSCAPKQTEAAVTSSQGASASPAAPFAAVNCSMLNFEPKLTFRLRGGTHRGAHPSLRAVVTPRPGDANIAGASVALPHSAFLDQGHIKTVCTRVEFSAHSCPSGSIYGHAEARSPLFDEAFSGPVYLRSSSHPLPDLVAALKGPDSLPIEIDLAGRIDSVNGGIRSTFDVVPDAPVTSFVLTMQGGKRGLLVNSTNLCAKVQRAIARLTAQNGRGLTLRPAMKASCGQKQQR